MNVVQTVFASLLASICVGAAFRDFRRDQRVVTIVARLGIGDDRLPLFGAVKVLCAVGVVVGIWSSAVAWASGGALVLYFVLALAAHVRVRDRFARMVPAFLLLVAAITHVLAAVAAA